MKRWRSAAGLRSVRSRPGSERDYSACARSSSVDDSAGERSIRHGDLYSWAEYRFTLYRRCTPTPVAGRTRALERWTIEVEKTHYPSGSFARAGLRTGKKALVMCEPPFAFQAVFGRLTEWDVFRDGWNKSCARLSIVTERTYEDKASARAPLRLFKGAGRHVIVQRKRGSAMQRKAKAGRSGDDVFVDAACRRLQRRGRRTTIQLSFQTSTSPSLPATYSMVRSVERKATT